MWSGCRFFPTSYTTDFFTGFSVESKNSDQDIPIFNSKFYSKSKTRKKKKTKTINPGINGTYNSIITLLQYCNSKFQFYLRISSATRVPDIALEKTEAVTTLCRNIATNVKSRALRHWDGQLKSAWSGHRIRFFHLSK